MKTIHKKNGGFTLVELIVVIAILAILAAVAIPAYSGYIAKAEEANDLQLLGALNTAFNAACVENGVSILDMDNATNGGAGSAEFVLSNGLITKLKVPGASASVMATAFTADQAQAILKSFSLYFGDNMNTPFKVYVQIVFADGAFEGVTADEATVTIQTESGITVTMKKQDAEKFVESVYGTSMESAVLLGKVDLVTNFAADMMTGENANASITQLFQSPKYIQSLAATLGVSDISTPEGQNAFIEAGRALARKKAKELDSTLTDEYLNSEEFYASQMYQNIEAEFTANNAVLFAAQNSAAASSDILDILSESNSKATIATNLLSQDSNDVGLSQAAIAYGLYTAYAQRNGVDMDGLTPTQVLTKLDTDADFKAYIKGENIGQTSTAGQAEEDLAGFLAAMNMINDNSNNEGVVTDVLLNGFNTSTLNDLLNQAKGQ